MIMFSVIELQNIVTKYKNIKPKTIKQYSNKIINITIRWIQIINIVITWIKIISIVITWIK